MRRVLLLAALASCGAGLTFLPVASAAGASHAVIKLRQTKVGKILVNRAGFTIYAFTKDKRNKDNCQKITNCLKFWPPVLSKGKPVAKRGVRKSLLGTIKLKNGKRQVTYRGHPLYLYIGDSSPGQTYYVNFFQFGGFWPALNRNGKEVTG